MIPAKHTAWADLLFRPYLVRLLRRHFHAIRILGDMPSPSVDLPLLLLPNHSTWWDGFFVYLLNKRHFRRPAYLMMLEEQLSRYPFFSRLGVFSIQPTSPKSAQVSLNYAISLLAQPSLPRALMCLFPQGELQPWGARPLEYRRGVEWILRQYGRPVHILPLAIRCEFRGEQCAETFLLFGQNRLCDAHTFPGTDWLEDTEETLLDEMALRIAQGETGRILLQGRRSPGRGAWRRGDAVTR